MMPMVMEREMVRQAEEAPHRKSGARRVWPPGAGGGVSFKENGVLYGRVAHYSASSRVAAAVAAAVALVSSLMDGRPDPIYTSDGRGKSSHASDNRSAI